jgi:hypothetical protein
MLGRGNVEEDLKKEIVEAGGVLFDRDPTISRAMECA